MVHHVLAALLVALAVAGCEEDVVAVLDSDRPYSLYGVFTPQLDTQWVRVYPIDDVLELESPEPLDARFTSQDMQTGEVRTWRDSVLVEPDGQFSHVFWSPFAAEYGHEYAVVVERADGAASRVHPAVPVFAELVPEEASLAPATHPVRLDAPVPRLFDIDVTYSIRYRLPGSPVFSERYILDYDGRARRDDDGWRIIVQLWQDFSTIRDDLIERANLELTADIALTNIRMELVVASEDWDPPGGVFDPDVLVQPGVFSNVENGFGFVGAGYRQALDWMPPDEVVEAAGFTPAPEDDDELNPGKE